MSAEQDASTPPASLETKDNAVDPVDQGTASTDMETTVVDDNPTSPNQDHEPVDNPNDAAMTAAEQEESTSAKEASEASAKNAGDTQHGATASPPATSVKKNQKRRSSVIPEHKGKKLNRKKSAATMNLDAKPGDYFWARLKGYPPWPAIICDEEMLPESLLATRPVTAMRVDGTYRRDYDDEGKNARDRTYPVMFLGTNEFSWMTNVDLTRLDLDEVKNAEQGKKGKALWNAYDVAKDGNDLQWYKDLLRQHEQDLADETEELARLQTEKEAKKEKKAKRKSKDVPADDEDTQMDDAEEEPATTEDALKEKKASKKRKKDVESEGESTKPAKTPKSKLKVNVSKAANGESASKSKGKASAKKTKTTKETSESEAQPTEEEERQKREKEVLYFRHKLQRGFLTRDQTPKEEEMGPMAEYFASLEKYTDLDVNIIRATKIHKVLKAILKLSSIPKDEEYHFKDRCTSLLDSWSKLLVDEGDTQTKEEVKPNGLKSEFHGDEKAQDSTVHEKPAAKADAEAEAEVEETSTKAEEENPADPPAEVADEGSNAKDEANATVANGNEEDPVVASTEEVATE